MRRRSRGRLLGTFIILALAACAAEETPPPLKADLVVATGPVSVDEAELGTGEGESIALGNQITVGPGARGFLTFGSLGTFELFPNAAIRLEIWEQTEAGAFLGGGHVSFTEDEESPTRLTLETSSSIIKTLEPATKFTVCQPSTGNTCSWLKREGSNSPLRAFPRSTKRARERLPKPPSSSRASPRGLRYVFPRTN